MPRHTLFLLAPLLGSLLLAATVASAQEVAGRYRVRGPDYAGELEVRPNGAAYAVRGEVAGHAVRGSAAVAADGAVRVRYRRTAGLADAFAPAPVGERAGTLRWRRDRLRLAGEVGGAAETWTRRARPGTALIKVMTVNTMGRGGHARDVIGLIEDEAPDVVGMQEVFKSHRKRYRELEDAGYDFAFSKTFTLIPFLWEEGNALLVRGRLEDLEREELPGGLFRRTAVRARARLDAGLELDLYTTHFHHPSSSSAERTRVRQARSLLDWLEGSDGLALLTGDYNTRPDGDVYPLLAGPEGGLVDAWGAAEPGQPEGTIGDVDGDERIDYVFVPRAAVGSGRVRVVHTWMRGRGRAEDDPRVSDHRAVLTVLEVRVE